MNLLVEAFVWSVDLSHRWIGRGADAAAEKLETTAEHLRLLAILTRAAP